MGRSDPSGFAARAARCQMLRKSHLVEPGVLIPTFNALKNPPPQGRRFHLDSGEGGIDSSGAAFAALTLAGRSAHGLRVQTLPQAEFVEPEGSSTPPTPAKSKKGPTGPF